MKRLVYYVGSKRNVGSSENPTKCSNWIGKYENFSYLQNLSAFEFSGFSQLKTINRWTMILFPISFNHFLECIHKLIWRCRNFQSRYCRNDNNILVWAEFNKIIMNFNPKKSLEYNNFSGITNGRFLSYIFNATLGLSSLVENWWS